MYPWCIDAREAIKNLIDIDDGLIEKTSDIIDFLEKDKFYFVVATKGLGKSLLLLLKRKGLKGKSVSLVLPKDNLLDAPSLIFEALNNPAKALLYSQTSNLWKIAITLAVLKNLHLLDKVTKTWNDKGTLNASDSLLSLISNKLYINVSSFFSGILSDITQKEFFKDILHDYNRILLPQFDRINSNVAIFIDNIDECFRHAPRDIWYTAQISLIEAVYDLVRINPKIKIYASIRREAFLKLDDEMAQQYSGVSLKLIYQKDELRKIFIKNIFEELAEKFVDEKLREHKPIEAFIGTKIIPHGHVNDEEETFDYLYRHTLKRPRDFMEMGSEISRVSKDDRNPNSISGLRKFKSIINETGTIIAKGYIKEVIRHLTFKENDLYKVFKLIDSNVLDKDTLKTLCMKINDNNAECLSMDCKLCKDKTHIFCELYKIGLLGYVDSDFTQYGGYIQKFAMVGEKTFDNVGLLPDSPFYLVHPVLDQLIRENNLKYKDNINSDNIVGYERNWSMRREVAERQTKPTLFVSSSIDLKDYRNSIEKITEKNELIPIRIGELSRPNILDECKNISKDCNIFVALLGSRYRDVIQDKSISEHEFDAAFEDNPNKIIIYIIGDPSNWDYRQKDFYIKKVLANKGKLSYVMDSILNLNDIEKRFAKDLIEKISILNKKRA